MSEISREASNLNIDSSPLLFEKKEQQVISDFHVLQSAIHQAIAVWADHSDDAHFFLSIDGISGGGKTTICEAVRNILSKYFPELSLHTMPVDNFITTDRGSEERKHMNDNAHLFWQRIYDADSYDNTIRDIIRSNGRGGIIQNIRLYNRSIGKVMLGNIEVPSGRKVVLMEGLNTTQRIQKLLDIHPISKLSIILHTAIDETLNRAVKRDVEKSGVDFEMRRSERVKEYEYQVPQIFGVNIQQADIVYMQE